MKGRRPEYRTRSGTRLIIIHDSHTTADHDNVASWLRWHGYNMGLLDIGYHYLVERDGGLMVTRPLDSVGAHAPGLNHESIGICLLGGADAEGKPEDNFTDAQIEALRVLLRKLKGLHRAAKVVGHSEVQKVRRDKRSIPCPCLDMDLLREAIR